MKMKKKGFSVVEILIVIFVVGALVAVASLVYKRQKNQNNTPVTKQNNQQDSAKEVVPDGWKKYDSNENFSFIYPVKWEKSVKVTELPTDTVLKSRYIGEVKLNDRKDGWIFATDYNGATLGEKADIVEEEASNNLKVWRFGFGDGGYGSFTPTFVAKDRLYEITTDGFCAESSADCPNSTEYRDLYDKLVLSIKLK